MYMHGEEIVHGDLKGVCAKVLKPRCFFSDLILKANILINQDGRACLADFSITTTISDPAHPTTSNTPGAAGTTRWMSPERLNPVQFGVADGRPTKDSDCYALGMVILEVLSGDVPFTRDCNEFMVMKKVLEGKRPGRPQGEWFTDDLWEMLQACWSPRKKDRPAVEAVFDSLMEISTAFQPTPPSADGNLKVSPDDGFGSAVSGGAGLTEFPPVANKALLKLGVESQFVPFFVSTMRQIEQLPSGLPQLMLTEAKIFVEILDKVCPHAWTTASHAEQQQLDHLIQHGRSRLEGPMF